MGHLSTHVLDTARGEPGSGIGLVVYRLDGERREALARAGTNADGRCDAPLLEGDAFAPGEYEIHFAVGDYFGSNAADGERGGAREDAPLGAPRRFLDTVVIRFGVASPDEHYHVPLLVSPFAYCTYRGS